LRILPKEGQCLAQLLHGLPLQSVQHPQCGLGCLQKGLQDSVKKTATAGYPPILPCWDVTPDSALAVLFSLCLGPTEVLCKQGVVSCLVA
jgi:hypothetical protein